MKVICCPVGESTQIALWQEEKTNFKVSTFLYDGTQMDWTLIKLFFNCWIFFKLLTQMSKFEKFKKSIVECIGNLTRLLWITNVFNKQLWFKSLWNQNKRPMAIYHNTHISSCPSFFMNKTLARLIMIIQEALHKCKIKMFVQKLLLTQSLVTFEKLKTFFNVISYFRMHKLCNNLCKLNATITNIATHNLILQGLNHKETFHKHGLEIT